MNGLGEYFRVGNEPLPQPLPGAGRGAKGARKALGRRFGFLWILLCGIAFWGCGTVAAPSVETQKVARGDFVSRVTVTGELEAVNSRVIAAPPVSGRFGQLKISKLVEDGHQVQADELLVQFDPAEVQKAITDAQANLEIAEAELRKAQAKHKAEIEGMAIDLEVARINHQIAKLKLEQGTFKAEIDRKQDEYNLEEAAIKLEQAEGELTNTRNIQREEISKLELRVKQSQARLDEAQHTLGLLSVKAPTPGIAILQKSWMTGNKYQVDDGVYPGWPIIGLPDLSVMKAQVQVNEIDIAKIEVGQEARIALDAYPDTSFTGKVVEIAMLARNKSRDVKVKVFDVTVILDHSDDRLLPGLTVSCDIMVDRVSDVLSVPLAAVFERDEKTVVFVRNGRGFETRTVRLGAENDTYVVVEDGLSEGDEIALADPTVKPVSASEGEAGS